MFRLVTSSAIIALLTAPALADVTPTEVWENYQVYMRLSGLEVVSSEVAETGNGLKVSKLEVKHLKEGGEISLDFDQLTFSQTGANEVRIEGPTSIHAELEDDVVMNLKVTGLALLASGNPDEVVYKGDGDQFQVGFEIEDLEDKTSVTGVVEPKGYTLEMTVSTGDMDRASTASSFDELQFSANTTGFEDMEAFGVTGMLDSVVASSEVSVPSGGNMVVPAAIDDAIKAGGTRSQRVEMGAFEMAALMSELADEGEGSKINNGQFSFDSANSTSKVTAQGASGTSEITNVVVGGAPAGAEPMLVSIAKLAGEFSAPLTEADEAQPASMRFEMGDLTLNENLWYTFDPKVVFKRTPSNLLLDLSANIKLDRPFMEVLSDLRADFKNMDDTPEGEDAKSDEKADDTSLQGLELVDLKINKFNYSALGASLSASGAFDFAQGYETPEGKVELLFTDIAKVISQFGQAGVIGPDEAMSAQMALGMFATPVEGGPEGQMKSVFETSGGKISVNGMQMP